MDGSMIIILVIMLFGMMIASWILRQIHPIAAYVVLGLWILGGLVSLADETADKASQATRC